MQIAISDEDAATVGGMTPIFNDRSTMTVGPDEEAFACQLTKNQPLS